MLIRSWPAAIAVICVLAHSSGQAQVVEEEETEVLKPLEKKYEPVHIPDRDAAAAQIIKLVNEFRKEEKRDALKINPALAKAARYFADYMARTGRYGHKADGSQPADRATKQGYEYCIVAENIAYEYSSEGFTTEELAQNFVEGWKHSPGHRKNMLDPDVVETGLAVSHNDETGYFFAVQLFGRPKSMAVEFQITNESPVEVEYKMQDRTFTLAPRHTRTHQVCRPRDLEFQWPDAKGEEQTVRPQNGDHFIVTQDGDALQLRKE
jgi:uncharacterized protein YkwD